MSGRILTERLLATTSLAALLFAVSTPDAQATSCTMVAPGGSVTNTGPVACVVVPTGSSVSVTNNAGATIGPSASSGAVRVASGGTLTGGITNSGTITNSVTSGVVAGIGDQGLIKGGITNSGTITVSSTGALANYGAIALVGVSDTEIASFGGGITNSGILSISGTARTGAVITINASAFSGDVVNSGTIAGTLTTSDGGAAYGIKATAGIFSGSVSNGGTISIISAASSSAQVAGLGIFINTVTGGITNSGTIAATGTGGFSCQTVSVAGVEINANIIGAGLGSAGGAVVNSGMIAASATNSGHGCAFSNCGFAFARATAVGIDISGNTFNGGITNSGTITASAMATGATMATASATGLSISVNTFIGGLTNNGVIAASASSTARLACVNAGCNSSLTAAGAIGINISANTFNGGIFNGGTISATASYSNGCCGNANAVGVNISVNTFNGGISIAHGGTISAAATVSNSCEASAFATGLAISADTFNGGITNNGTISASAMVTGSMDSQATAAGLSVYGTTFTGGITNNGTISASATASDTPNGSAVAEGVVVEFSTFLGGFTNNGIISASATVAGSASYDARAFGLVVSADTFSGGISNAGTISATATAPEVGSAELDATAVLVRVGTFSGGISNSGTILATEIGGSTERGVPIGIEVDTGIFSGGIGNSGTISVLATSTSAEELESTGIAVFADTFSGGITNSGTISAVATSALGNTNAYGIGIELNGTIFSGGLSNGGTISATASIAGSGRASAIGLLVGVATFGGGISNSGSIVARASSPGNSASAIGIFATSNFAGSIVNSGTIAGLITGGTGIGAGIMVSGAGAVTITNSGLVEGTTWGISELHSLTNPGTLTINLTGGTIAGSTNTTSGGAIQLSSFADTINISGGTIIGNVAGGGAANTVNVNLGTGTFAYAYEIEGIGTLNLKSGTLLLQNLSAPGVSTVSYNQSAGSTLALEVSPAATNNHASVAASGTVSLASGSAFQAFEGAFAWTPGNYTYAGVVTGDTITGSFASATSNSPFFTASLAQSTTVDNLNLTMLSPSQVPGLNANQVSVANAIIGIPGGNPTLDQLFELPGVPMSSGPSAGLPTAGAALTQLSGSQFTQTNYQPLIQAWQMFTDSLTDRLSQGDGYGGTVSASLNPSQGLQFAAADVPQVAQMSDAGHGGGAPSMAHRWGAWARGYGLSSTAPSTATSAPYSESGAGLIVGADNQITDRIVAGVALNIATDKATVTGGGFTQSNAYQGSVYGQYSVDPNWYVNGVAGFGWQNYSTARVVTLLSTSVNNGNFDGQSYRLYGETGYTLHPAFLPQARVTPYLGLGYLHVHTDGFTETGSASALSVQAMDPNSFATTIGARLAASWQIGSTVFRPELRAAWQHELLDDSATVRASFATAPGSPVFTATGTSFGSDSFLGGAGVTTTITSSTQLFFDYDAKVTGGYTAQAVSGGFRVQF